jgi:hypothetical protein
LRTELRRYNRSRGVKRPGVRSNNSHKFHPHQSFHRTTQRRTSYRPRGDHTSLLGLTSTTPKLTQRHRRNRGSSIESRP